MERKGKETKLSKYTCKILDTPLAGFCATGAAWLYSLPHYMVYSFCQPGAPSFFFLFSFFYFHFFPPTFLSFFPTWNMAL